MLDEKKALDLAARLAMRARGFVEPNPMVGCVLARDGRIIGMGHHRRFGGLHAEREALADCAQRGEDPRGATAYVTLEPCNGHGKQPPCVEALIGAGLARVVYAAPDLSEAKGGGAERLRSAGIEAVRSGASPLASGLAAPFMKRLATGLPWVIAKWAQTIDGRIATRSGESKWISNDRSRARVHRLRSAVDAILTGMGTVAADDPLLTARGVGLVRRTALRVVADTDLDVPMDAQLIRSAHTVPTLIACETALAGAEITRTKRERLTEAGASVMGVPGAEGGRGLDLRALLAKLWEERGVSSVLIEAGPGRLAESLSAARRYSLWRMKALGSDVELTYRRAG